LRLFGQFLFYRGQLWAVNVTLALQKLWLGYYYYYYCGQSFITVEVFYVALEECILPKWSVVIHTGAFEQWFLVVVAGVGVQSFRVIFEMCDYAND